MHMPGWWTFTAVALSKSAMSILDDLSDVPGVQTVSVRGVTHATLQDVRIVLHASALQTPPMLMLRDAFELELPTPSSDTSEPALVSTLRTLRTYQQDGARWLLQQQGGVLGDEMGLGKTTTAIVAAETFRQHHNPRAPVLIIGPRFTRDVWRRELQSVLGETPFFACEGRKPTQAQETELSWARWIFVHYEILDGWRAALTHPMFGRRPCVSIFDEAHWLQNPRAKRTKSALAVGPLAAMRIVLSGTPIANRVTDLWPLLTLARGVGSFGMSPFAFAHRYTVHEHTGYGWASFGTRRMAELHTRLDGVYLRRTLTEVGAEIPPLTREQYVIQPEATIPRRLRRWTGSDPAAALHRIRDALAQGAIGGDTLEALTEWRKWTSETKLPATVHMTASLLREAEHVVVFVWQRETAELLAQSVRDCVEDSTAAVHVVHGGIAQEFRDATVQEFQTSSAPMAIVATIDSLKEGVTLHRARRVILHDLHWVPAVLLQAEARINRLGQTRPCVSTWMIVEQSVDQVIADHLANKAATITAALGDTRAEDAFDDVGLQREDTTGAEFARRILEGL